MVSTICSETKEKTAVVVSSFYTGPALGTHSVPAVSNKMSKLCSPARLLLTLNQFTDMSFLLLPFNWGNFPPREALVPLSFAIYEAYLQWCL